MAGTPTGCLESPGRSGAGDGRQPGIIQRGTDPERHGGAVLGDPDRRDARRCGCPACPASLSCRYAERYGRSGRTLAEPPLCLPAGIESRHGMLAQIGLIWAFSGLVSRQLEYSADRVA
jgi:hypothetical protein